MKKTGRKNVGLPTNEELASKYDSSFAIAKSGVDLILQDLEDTIVFNEIQHQLEPYSIEYSLLLTLNLFETHEISYDRKLDDNECK